MKKVANTEFALHLQATLWSSAKNQWLITSTKEEDTPLAVIVDEACKESILRLQDFYNSLPAAIIKIVKKNYQRMIDWAHRFEAEANSLDSASAEHALFPFIGITNEEIIEGDENTPTMKKIEYIINNDPMRYIQAYVDEELYTALSAIATDWQMNQRLYHYVFTQKLQKFENFVMRNKEEDAA